MVLSETGSELNFKIDFKGKRGSDCNELSKKRTKTRSQQEITNSKGLVTDKAKRARHIKAFFSPSIRTPHSSLHKKNTKRHTRRLNKIDYVMKSLLFRIRTNSCVTIFCSLVIRAHLIGCKSHANARAREAGKKETRKLVAELKPVGSDGLVRTGGEWDVDGPQCHSRLVCCSNVVQPDVSGLRAIHYWPILEVN